MSAAASPNRSVRLPVWIAEITGGQRSDARSIASPARSRACRVAERPDHERRHHEESGRLERQEHERNHDSAGSGGYGYGPPHAAVAVPDV